MSNKKRWSKSECLLRYISGDRITLKALSELSGVPESTLKKWSAGSNGEAPWYQQRQEFFASVESKARDKSAATLSDVLADQMNEMAIAHFETYKMCREVATLKLRFILEHLQQAHKPIQHPELSESEKANMEDQMKAASLEKLNLSALNILSIVVDRAIRGERMSLGMEYDDINKAIAAVERTGLQVIIPDDATLAKLVGGSQSTSATLTT